MTDVPISKVIFFLILLISSVLVFSCSDSDPEISDARGFVVFDYAAEKSNPAIKLAAFAEAASEVQRVDSVSIKNRSTGYEWTSFNPVLLSDEKKKWAGCSDFVSPAGQNIPTGIYDLTYTDAQNKAVSKTFSIFYNDDFITSDSSEVESLLGDSKQEEICVYSEKGTLLYYGLRKSNWSENKNIFTSVKDSSYYRICYISPDRMVYCLMPPVYKSTENTTSEKSEKK